MGNPPGRCLALPLMLLIAGLLLIPAVSAESAILTADHSVYHQYTSVSPYSYTSLGDAKTLRIYEIQEARDVEWFYGKYTLGPYTVDHLTETLLNSPSGTEPFTLTHNGDVIAVGSVSYNTFFNDDDEPTQIQVWYDFESWDIGSRTGSIDATINPMQDTLVFSTSLQVTKCSPAAATAEKPLLLYGAPLNTAPYGSYIVGGFAVWQNIIDVDEEACTLTITRGNYFSTISINSSLGAFTDSGPEDRIFKVLGVGNWSVTNYWGDTFDGDFGVPSTPSTPSATATVYVQSSQTGAFVSNALVNATHLETGASIEKLLPSGSGTLSLIPSSGEVANYEFNVTAPGYHDHILRLLVSGDMSIPVNLMPLGTELPENQTTLKFTIHQSTGGWLSGATVQLNDGRSGLTNAAGYCEFVVEKNSTISYSVKKTGFYPLSGSVVMGIYERVILHSLIPTDVPLPTPTNPEETPGATPTPDRRTNEEKGQSIIDMIADNAEGIAALAIIGTLLGLLKLIAKW